MVEHEIHIYYTGNATPKGGFFYERAEKDFKGRFLKFQWAVEKDFKGPFLKFQWAAFLFQESLNEYAFFL